MKKGKGNGDLSLVLFEDFVVLVECGSYTAQTYLELLK